MKHSKEKDQPDEHTSFSRIACRCYRIRQQSFSFVACHSIDRLLVRRRSTLLALVVERVVPPQETTYLLKKRLEQHGHALDVVSVAKGTAKSNGRQFDHPEPNRVVAFIARHAIGAEAASHKRPGIKKDLPISEAEQQAQEISTRLQVLLEQKP